MYYGLRRRGDHEANNGVDYRAFSPRYATGVTACSHEFETGNDNHHDSYHSNNGSKNVDRYGEDSINLCTVVTATSSARQAYTSTSITLSRSQDEQMRGSVQCMGGAGEQK